MRSPGTGLITINNKSIQYFEHLQDREQVRFNNILLLYYLVDFNRILKIRDAVSVFTCCKSCLIQLVMGRTLVEISPNIYTRKMESMQKYLLKEVYEYRQNKEGITLTTNKQSIDLQNLKMRFLVSQRPFSIEHHTHLCPE